MKILFWNTHKNENINTIISELITDNNISIVVLAEYTADVDELLQILTMQSVHMKQYISAGCDRIKIIGSVNQVEPGKQTDHASIQIIDNDIVLCGIHLNSPIYSGHQEQREIYIEQIINDIKSIEKELNTENTIIVGDFNVNPYDVACVDARYFHGIPICEEANRKTRTISGKEYSMFYNPMWNFFGDKHQPYGTYYYGGSNTVNTYWNIYDQVIIRPALKERFIDESLKILTETKTKYLLDRNGHPDNNISDHLPIVFEIKEDYHG